MLDAAAAFFGAPRAGTVRCATSFPMALCPISALKTGGNLKQFRVAFSEQAFIAARVMHGEQGSSKRGCSFATDHKLGQCFNHGKICKRPTSCDIVLAQVLEGDPAAIATEWLAKISPQAMGLCLQKEVAIAEFREVALHAGYTCGACSLSPSEMGMPSMEGKHHILLFVRSGMPKDAETVATQLMSWKLPIALALGGCILPSAHPLVHGAELHALRNHGHESADPLVIARLIADARKRKQLPTEWSTPEKRVKVKPSWGCQPRLQAHMEVAAYVAMHHGNGDSMVAIDVHNLGTVTHAAIPRLRHNSVILVGKRKRSSSTNIAAERVWKCRIMIPAELLMAKGYPTSCSNLAMVSDQVAQSLIMNTISAPVAIGMLYSLASAVA
jgi:hypothetical protein